MTIEEIDTYDKRQVAAHEAGHLVVAVVGGGRCRAWIKPTHTPDPSRTNTWTGATRFDLVRPYNPGAVAVAGAVAELLSGDPDGLTEECADAEDIADFIYNHGGHISPTDKVMLAKANVTRYEPFYEAVAILREYEDFHRWAVAELLEWHYISDGAASDYFRGIGLAGTAQ